MPTYPQPHFAPLQASVLSNAPGHSSPPAPTHFHKDERTIRQYNKLKKKLEQKQQRVDQSLPSPPFSPKKGKKLWFFLKNKILLFLIVRLKILNRKQTKFLFGY